MKATGFANVIGVALENFNQFSPGENQTITIGSATTTVKVGKVNTFVSLGQKKLDVNRTEDGKLITEIENFDYDFSGFNLSQVKSLTSLSGKWALGEDGTASTTKLCIETSCINQTQLQFVLDLTDLIYSTSTESTSTSTDSTGSPQAATTTEATSAFALSTLFEKIWNAVLEKFASAANGITKFFAKEVYTEKLCIKKSDGTDICLTGDELENLSAALGAGASVSGGSSLTDPAPTDSLQATSTEPVIEETQAATSTEPVVETTPEEVIVETPVEVVEETIVTEEPPVEEAASEPVVEPAPGG